MLVTALHAALGTAGSIALSISEHNHHRLYILQ
jgi:hypothetical protein